MYDRRDQMKWDIEKKKSRIFLNHLIETFDRIFIMMGNHDVRILRQLAFEETFRTFIDSISSSNKVQVSEYPKATINDSWFIAHPKSYSQISGNVAKRLAEKYHMNIIATHGHFSSRSYDRSGLFVCIDCGGLVDYEKTEYVNYAITTHPMWNNSFVLLLDNQARLIDEMELKFNKAEEKIIYGKYNKKSANQKRKK